MKDEDLVKNLAWFREEAGLESAYPVTHPMSMFIRAIAARERLKKREWVSLTDEEARVKFESWHKAEYVQPLERYGHTYKNMHVRNRWQGWLAANGIKEKQND